MKLNLIVARNQDNIIAINKEIPWYVPEDFHWFKTQTEKHAVVMGRNTYDEIGKPLPNRLNIVLTSRPLELQKGLTVCNNLDEAIEVAKSLGYEKLFIIGGKRLYDEYIDKVSEAYITDINIDLDINPKSILDTFEHDLNNSDKWTRAFNMRAVSKTGIPYSVNRYVRN